MRPEQDWESLAKRLRRPLGLALAAGTGVLGWAAFTHQAASSDAIASIGSEASAAVSVAPDVTAVGLVAAHMPAANPASSATRLSAQPAMGDHASTRTGTSPAASGDCKALLEQGREREQDDAARRDGVAARTDRLQDAVVQALQAQGSTATRHAALLFEVARGTSGQPARRETTAAAAAQLAREALAGGGVQSYAWALKACEMVVPPKPAACGGLTNQRWSELAAQSVWPWLELAAEAQQAGDASGLETAFHRASLATDWRHPIRDLQSLLVPQLPGGASDLDKAAILTPGLSALVASMPMTPVIRYCPVDADANRRQSCQRLAGQMLAHADTLLELKLGLVLAQRAGMPEAQLERARAEVAAAEGLFALTEPAAVGNQQACASLTRMLRRMVRLSEVGELQALREEAAKLSR